MKKAVAFVNRQIVDTRITFLHEAVFVELPVFVAVGTEPLAFGVMPFVSKAHGDMVVRKSPKFLDQPILIFICPFALQECDNLFPSYREFRTVSPLAIDGISQGDFFRVAVIPAILCHAYLLGCGFMAEGWEWWA